MKKHEIKQRIIEAHNELVHDAWVASRHYGGPDFDERVRERGKFQSCGYTLISPRSGCEVRHYCRRPVCPDCSTFWGRALGRKFVARYTGVQNAEFRMITMMLGITSDLDDAFSLFKARRKAMTNAVGYQRSRGHDRAGWRDFGIAGALEIDHFLADEFDELGQQKQQQYRDLGYDPQMARGSQWVITVHGISFVGGLGDDTVTESLLSVAPIIHSQPIYDWQPLDEAAENVVGYGAKVVIETSLASGQSREWPMEAVKEYVLATKRNSHGRQGFRIMIGPKSISKLEKRSSIQKVVTHDDAMPIVF